MWNRTSEPCKLFSLEAWKIEPWVCPTGMKSRFSPTPCKCLLQQVGDWLGSGYWAPPHWPVTLTTRSSSLEDLLVPEALLDSSCGVDLVPGRLP